MNSRDENASRPVTSEVRLRPFDASGDFRSPVDGVRRLAIQSAGATMLSGGAVVAVQIVATMVLARILTPRDFGLVAMVSTFSLLLTNFGLNGFTEAVLQQEKLDHPLASNLFWINLGVGLFLTVGFAAAGSLLAAFYREPLVNRVALGMSLTIVLTSTSVLHLALLKRAMRFPTTSVIDIVARMSSVAVSIILGLAGWGYWALIAGSFAQPLVQTIGAWWVCPWVPSLPRRAAATGSMVRFALHVYGRFSVNYFARNTDNLLVGWCFGAHSLGFYKKAYDLFALPVSVITSPLENVAVRALSSFKRGSDQYKQNLISALGVLAFLGMAVGAGLTLVGKDLIRLLLGPGWEESGRIFTFFGLGIGVMLLYYAHGWIHLSIGRADRWFRWGLIEFGFTFLAFLVALPWGPGGIAVAWTASFWILIIPAFWYAGRPIQLGVSPVIAAVWKYLVASLLAEVASALVMRQFPSVVTMSGMAGALTRIAMMTALFAALYLAAIILLHRGYAPIRQLMELLRETAGSFTSRLSPTEPGTAVPLPCPSLPPPVASFPSTPSESAGGLGTSSLPHPKATEQPPDRTPRSSGWVKRHGTSGQPMVSILIPAYNAERWIADTLRSALGQIWECKEVIVVDDGSTDRTLAIARQFECRGARVVTQKSAGAAKARNLGLSLCHGDYIQWLDADDLLAPDKISRQMDALDECPDKRVLFSSAWGRFMYRYYGAEFAPSALWCDLSPLEFLLRKMAGNIYMQTASWLVSRELTEAAGPWDDRLLSDDDGEYFCRVLLASKRVRFVPEAKVYYRGPGLAFRSLSYIGQSARKLDALWLSMQLHIVYLRSMEDSERVRAACLQFLNDSLICFYPEMDDVVKQLEQIAKELGGQLAPPFLSWKYSWMKSLLGWRFAKRGQETMLKFRWSLEKIWDRALMRIEGKDVSAQW